MMASPLPEAFPRLSPVSYVSEYSDDVFWNSDHANDDCSSCSGAEATPSSRELVFRAELEFLVQASGEQGLKITSRPADFAKPSGTCSKGTRAQYLQFCLNRIFEHLEKSGLLSRDGSPKHKTDSSRDLSHGDGSWKVAVNEEDIQLPENITAKQTSYRQKWKLVRIRSPLMTPDEDNFGVFNTVLDTLKTTENLIIALNHIHRLRVEIKPLESDYTFLELKKIATFLWTASPRIDQLHAKYCGPGSTITPGLIFARAFNTLPCVHLSDALWRGDSAETVFTHGPPDPSTTQMLRASDPTRDFARSKLAFYEVSVVENLDALLEATSILAKGPDGELKILPGAYNFSKLTDPEPYERVIEFAQHAGTLDFAAIVNWIKVCHGLVSFCTTATQDRLDHILNQMTLPFETPGTSTETYTVYDLLNDIDVPAEATYYLSLGPHPFVPDLACHHRTPAVDLEDLPDLPPYTFGIELEFLLPYSQANTPDPRPSDPRWVYQHEPTADRRDCMDDARNYSFNGNADYLAGILNSADHFSSTFNTLMQALDEAEGSSKQALLIVARSAGHRLHIADDIDCRYQTWHVQPDYSLSNFHRGALGYSGGINGIELSSPILRDRGRDFDKIADVVRLIRGGMRPMLDPSCGFHVHVGNVRNFSLRSLKRILTLVWAADPVLYGLVHPSRSTNCYSLPVRKGSVLANEESLPAYEERRALRRDPLLEMEMESHIPMSCLPDRLKREFYRIWAANSANGLKNLLSTISDGRSGVSLQQIRPAGGDGGNKDPAAAIFKGTIEFRCLEGTLDPDLIVHWVRLVLAIVEKAEASTPWEFFKLMSAVLKQGDDEERLICFLDALGLTASCQFWAKVAAKQKTLAVSGKVFDRPSKHKMAMKDDETVRKWHEENTVAIPHLQ